jgi:integrase
MPKYYHSKDDFKIISQAEIYIMIQNETDERNKILVILAWLTGARIGEIIMLKGADIDIDDVNDELRMRLMTEKQKSHPTRELYFSIAKTPFLIEYIIPYVKNRPGKLFNIGIRRAQQLLKKNNEKTNFWFTFHEFRHSRLSYLARNLRASISEMMDWTGWASSSQVGTYVIRGAPKRFKDVIR